MQHDSPVPLDTVAVQGNNLRADGAEALRPALEKLTKLERLYLAGTCGDVQWRWVVVSLSLSLSVLLFRGNLTMLQ